MIANSENLKNTKPHKYEYDNLKKTSISAKCNIIRTELIKSNNLINCRDVP